MKRNNFFLLALFLLALPPALRAQITPEEAVEQMGLGINMGNTLEAPNEGEWAAAAEDYYFEDYATAGFKTLRIPVRWANHTATSTPFAIDETFMDRVEHLVDLALAEDLFVIINAHHEDWFKVDYTNQRPRFDSIWSQVIDRFQGKSEKLFFEIINEPRTHTDPGLTQAEIDELNVDILAMIREANPTRMVIYSGIGWTASNDMMAAAIPDDDYIMAYYHSYDPWNFAGEGIGSWGSASDIASLESSFNNVAAWSASNNIQVLIGEYGCVHNADFNSRMKHYYHYTQNIIRTGIASAVWDDGGQFMMYHRSARTWDPTKDILLHSHLDGPDNLSVNLISDSAYMEMNWTNNASDYDRIFIERDFADTGWVQVASMKGDTTFFRDTSLVEFGYYTYRVIAHYIDSVDYYSYPQQKYLLPTERFTYNDSPFPIPGTVEAEEYDIGGELLTYHDTEPANQGGAFRLDEGVDIEAITAGGYQLSYIDDGEWIEYSLNVEKDTSYLIEIHAASDPGGGSFRIKIGDQWSSIVEIPATGGWQTSNIFSTFMNLEAGEQIMRIEISTGLFNLDKLVFSMSEPDASRELKADFKKSKAYPNPVDDILNIEIGTNSYSRVSILDITGKELITYEIEARQSQLSIPVSELNAGIYFLQLSGNAGQEIVRIVKL